MLALFFMRAPLIMKQVPSQPLEPSLNDTLQSIRSHSHPRLTSSLTGQSTLYWPLEWLCQLQPMHRATSS